MAEASPKPTTQDDAAHTTCQKWKDFSCKYAPTTKFLIEELGQLGCKVDVEKHIKCVPCVAKPGLDRVSAGGYTPSEGVLICEESISSQAHMDRTIAHELVHMFDECRAKVNWANPRHHACSEVRAANLSGECKYFVEFMQSGNLRWKEGAKACARRRALKSMMKNPYYTAEQAERALDEVFDQCFADSAPFAMPP